MTDQFSVYAPEDGRLLATYDYDKSEDIEAKLAEAKAAQAAWRALPLSERQAIVARAADAAENHRDAIAQAISEDMGRPISQSGGEVGGFCERLRYMVDVAEAGLAPLTLPEKAGFERYIAREPLGVILVMAPWNFPFMTPINVIAPALVAGNAVLLKHSSQTQQVADWLLKVFAEAGLPAGLLSLLRLTHEQSNALMRDARIDYVAFTGSVGGGHAVQAALKDRFIGAGLELGGKDPAYVRADADVAYSAVQLVDGAMFNAGQSCCGIERIYVHASVYDDFVAAFVAEAKQLRLGKSSDPNTSLGPMVRASAADFARAQVQEAIAAGAKNLIDSSDYPLDVAGSAYLAPQVLVDVNHDMRVMTEETFAPVVGIMKVQDDEEALRLMNDSRYGLTASIWTQDLETAKALGAQIQTGTVFMNRCDYLDPALAWTGVKDTGRGISLSEWGYHSLTRAKSFHLKKGTS